MSADQVELGPTFRDVMAQVCTPVSVVTALDGERPHGTTVSAFVSLSMSPPMVLVSLDRRSELLGFVASTRRLGLNVLGTEQVDLARQFAVKGRDKFHEVDWRLQHGVPRIMSAPGWLACVVEDLVTGGDHVVAFARVAAANREPALPLTYHAREFGTHTALGRCLEMASPVTRTRR